MTDSNDYRKLISRIYSNLGKKKKKIADVILNNPDNVLEKNANELANDIGCDQATVVRFAQQLGYGGYADMKLAIAKETGALWQNYESTTESVSNFAVISNKLLQLHTEALKKTLNNTKEEIFTNLIKKISMAQKVMICGSGTSHLAAEDLNVKLMRQGINTICFADFQMWKTFLGYLVENDVLILFSHSGETSEIVNLASEAHKKGILITVVTGFEGSPLAKLSDYLILTECHAERSIRLGAMTSRTAQAIIVDLITICLSMKDKKHSWDLLEKSYEFTR
jgi:RpiR family carbohydrate utilization transcriptional regulator